MDKEEAIKKITANPKTVERLEKRGLTVEEVAEKMEACTREEVHDFLWQAWLICKSLE